MTTNEDLRPAPRPRTPRAPFELFELLRDGELIATGSEAQMRHDADELAAELDAGDAAYEVAPADLTGCERGAAGRHCPASTHAMH
jgi:hypothetical protein